MASPSPAPSASSGPANRHAPTPLEKQRIQLEKLLKDPSKPVNLPAQPKEKTLRPPREMMKNVQGSSAGAGSGEFHVYKASRRREYERLKLMDEKTQKEHFTAEFEEKKRQREEEAEAKTAKNRAKRQKKKERSKAKAGDKAEDTHSNGASETRGEAPLKKKRLVNEAAVAFNHAADHDDDEGSDREGPSEQRTTAQETLPSTTNTTDAVAVRTVEEPRIIIHDNE